MENQVQFLIVMVSYFALLISWGVYQGSADHYNHRDCIYRSLDQLRAG
jgi:hypothetical protein